MSRRRLPKPTQRNGSLTWEIRTRVGGKIVTRSLGTRDYDEALKRLPAAYSELLNQYERAAESNGVKLQKTGDAPDTSRQARQPSLSPTLTISEVCQRYRSYFLECERSFRSESAQGGVTDPAWLARKYRERLQRDLKTARDKAMVHDFEHQDWFLTLLSKSGEGDIRDRYGALMALARTKVATLREIVASDNGLLPVDTTIPEPKTAGGVPPTLSKLLDKFIAERGTALTAEVAASHRAVIRDFCTVAGDKSVTDYTREDARAFKEVLLVLPANWMKRRELRGLGILDAAKKADSLGLQKQRAKSIQLKRASLRAIFAFAYANYDGVFNPFEDKAGWAVADSSASDQRDAFSENELQTLLRSALPGDLYWLTWLGLCTGARLNELCQLTTDHIVCTPPEHIHFSPELRLKTGPLMSCVRKIPIHPKLLSLGFLDYVKDCQRNVGKKLFPDLPKHRTGRYSDAPSKAFSRHLKKLGIKRPKLSFHSLRHSFAAEFKRTAPRDIEARERLMGHHVPGVAGRYGGSYEAEAADFVLLHDRARIVPLLQFNY